MALVTRASLFQQTDNSRPAPASRQPKSDYGIEQLFTFCFKHLSLSGPLGSKKLIGALLSIIWAMSCTHVSPEFVESACDLLGTAVPLVSEFEACLQVPYTIPNFGTLFSKGADTLEQLNLTGANARNRQILAIDIQEAHRAMNELKVRVKFSDIPKADVLAEHLQSYAENARETAERLMDTDFEATLTLDKFKSDIDYVTSILEEAKGKNMGKKVKALWAEFKTNVREQRERLTRVIQLAQKSKISLEGLKRELESIHELIVQANKTYQRREAEMLDYLDASTKDMDTTTDHNESIQLLKRLAHERELGARRVDNTIVVLYEFVRHLDVIQDSAYKIVVNRDPHAANYVKLVHELKGATNRMDKLSKKIDGKAPTVQVK